MLISALFRSLCIPLNFNQSFFNHFLVDIVKSNLSFMQTSHFLVPNIINLARIWNKRRYIRRYKCFSHSLAQYHWIILTSYVYFFWIFFKHKSKCICTSNSDHTFHNNNEPTLQTLPYPYQNKNEGPFFISFSLNS